MGSVRAYFSARGIVSAASAATSFTQSSRQSDRGMPSESRLTWIPLAISIAMLLASGGDWPYGFYQLLRIVVTVTAVYVVVQTLNGRQYWPWLMGGIAILFNPILPIRLTKEQWQPIDFAVAVVFLIAVIQTLRRRF